MLCLDKNKLEALLKAKGMNMSILAKACGVSRQSIYNMLGRTSVFNTSFEKLLGFLQVGYEQITADVSAENVVAKDFPPKIAKVALELFRFAEVNEADLVLFGSRAGGKKGIQADWDFAVYFHKKAEDTKLRLLKQRLIDDAFPYRIDIINLNLAPEWFKTSISGQMVYLRKEERS